MPRLSDLDALKLETRFAQHLAGGRYKRITHETARSAGELTTLVLDWLEDLGLAQAPAGRKG
jgi:hypothetical protein